MKPPAVMGASRAGSEVGYRRPPVQHRFQKGVSGNPAGRPRREASEPKISASRTQLEDILLQEALRPIPIRENDEVKTLPMIQAVIRSMGVAAVKGSHKAQTALADMVQAVQAKRYQQLQEMFVSAIEYKDRWSREFEICELRGEPKPDPIPHPDEIALDTNTMQVRFNGPISPDDKAQWDSLLQRRQAALAEVAEYERLLRRPGKYKHFYEEDLAREKYLADMIGGILPDEETRRAPGFDLIEWRERKGTLAEMKRKRAKGKGSKNRRAPWSARGTGSLALK